MSVQIQVVKGRLFDKDYYSGTMTFAGIKRNVLLPDDKQWDILFGDADLGEGAQRKLNASRVKNEIVPYIVVNPDAFFSSLTLIMVPMGALGGLEEGHDYRFTPDVDPQTGKQLETGLLEFEDHVLLFPADGMHRSAAIVEALAEGGDIARRLADQQISVVLTPYHKPDEVRQLFADLNRNAKPVSQTVALNYEIRDPVVILSKRLASEIPLFHERVNMASNSLAPKSPYVIALNTLVTANTVLLAAMLNTKPKLVTKHADMVKLRGMQPSDDAVTGYASRLAEVWNVVIGAIPQWQGVTEKKVRAGELRGEGMEGYVFAFGLGWQALALAAAALIAHRPQTWKTDLVKAIQSVGWRKGPHWNGIAMVGERVNNTGPGVQATAGYILQGAGLTDKDGTEIKDLLEALKRSQAALATAA